MSIVLYGDLIGVKLHGCLLMGMKSESGGSEKL